MHVEQADPAGFTAAAPPELSAAQIIKELKDSPVYVQSGSPGTTSSTAGNISGVLAPDDHIVVAVLAGGQSDLDSVAGAISAGVGKDKIVVVSRGTDTVVSAPSLPGGVASDLLGRAQNVSTDQVDTIKTFAGNLHDYQAAHPETITSTEQPASPLVPIVIGGSSLIGVLLIAALSLYVYQRRIHSKVKGNAPRDVRPLVAKLMAQRSHITNRRMRDAIENTCIYVEAYFRRMKPTGRDREVTISRLQRQLESAFKIAVQYTDIEQEEMYFIDAREQLQSGESAMESLSDSMLQAIRQKSSLRLLDYEVDTQILDAERYRYRGGNSRH